MEFDQESNDQKTTEEPAENKTKQWLQDNMRIIISILIVILIAGGIYSYSKRTEERVAQEEPQELASKEDNNAALDEQPGEEKADAAEKTAPEKTVSPKTTSSVATSQETENSFIETAVRGDSQTRLARRALADFLEKNPDGALTAEHKIYIEDFLRKNVRHEGRILVGTSVEFSKDLIQNAITKSKTLNSNQLQNLHKYAVRVPSLS